MDRPVSNITVENYMIHHSIETNPRNYACQFFFILFTMANTMLVPLKFTQAKINEILSLTKCENTKF